MQREIDLVAPSRIGVAQTLVRATAAEGGLSPATIGLGLLDYRAVEQDMMGRGRRDGRMCVLDAIVCFNESQASGSALCVWED